MKVLVFSDSHGDVDHMEQVVRREEPYLVLHLGDMCRDFDELQARLPMQTMQNVCGNCDGFSLVPNQRVLSILGHRILMTHGHRYHVKQSYGSLYLAAREAEADLALFGHTHVAFCEREQGIWLLNPGTCRGGSGTYGVISLEQDAVTCSIRPVTEAKETKGEG